jgi:hypothetical protein
MARWADRGQPAAVDGVPGYLLRYDPGEWPEHRIWVAARVSWGRARGWPVAETNGLIRAAGGDGFYDHLRSVPDGVTP